MLCKEKETLSFNHQGLSSKEADGAPILPNALWALCVFSGLHELETHSKWDLLSGEAFSRMKICSLPNKAMQHIAMIRDTQMTKTKRLEESNFQCIIYSVKEDQPQ